MLNQNQIIQNIYYWDGTNLPLLKY